MLQVNTCMFNQGSLNFSHFFEQWWWTTFFHVDRPARLGLTLAMAAQSVPVLRGHTATPVNPLMVNVSVNLAWLDGPAMNVNRDTGTTVQQDAPVSTMMQNVMNSLSPNVEKKYVTVLVVNYGISNTVVLEIP